MFDFLGRPRGTAALAAASAIAIVAACSNAYAQEQARPFDIPAQPLASALIEFSRQSDAMVLADPALVSARQAPAVQGSFTPAEALGRLLAGSGLSVERQADGGYVLADPARSARPGAASNETQAQDEIVVTGTNIRGLRNPTAPILTFGRDDIARSGYGTVQDFVRSLPQNFRGGASGASEDGAVGPGAFAAPNQEAASGINLRGLGTSSTLVLLNGRRMAPAAFGSIADISVIPLAAVERIDVVTDGSSAVYGGDAVGGVVNFVLRRDFQGSETQLRYGGVTDGSMRTTIASQTLGAAWDGGGLTTTLQYQDRTALPSSERDFTASTPQPTDISPHTSKYAILLAAHDELTQNIDVFGDALVSAQDLFRRHRTATVTREIAASSLQESYNLGAGFDFSAWRVELRSAYGKQTTDFGYTLATPPLAGYTPGKPAQHNFAEVSSLEANADGPLFDLPGGAARMAAGAGYRQETFESLTLYLPLNSPVRIRGAERDVKSLYAEFYVPIVGDSNAVPFVRRIDLSLAARWDDYSDFGETTNPKAGLIWSPAEGLDLRASWSTSFRAPIASELLNQSQGVNLFNFQLPGPGGAPERLFVLSGVVPDLNPEESESWTAGFDYRPAILPDLRVSLNYYDIHFTNRIIQPTLNALVLAQPGVYGSLLTPLADDAAAAAFLADQIAQGVTFIDRLGVGSAGVRHVYSIQLQNAASVDQSGYDAAIQYAFEAGANRFDLGLSASVIDEIVTQLAPGSTPTDVVDTYFNPLSLRMRGSLGWSLDGWRVNAAINYNGSYTDNSAAPSRPVEAWSTADFTFAYEFGRFADGSPLSGVLLTLSVVNAFDEPPPYVVGAGQQPNIHYDSGNADPYGRIASVEIRKRW